jgi:hypothetical protein
VTRPKTKQRHRSHRRVRGKRNPVAGVCTSCGCTDARACDGGCGWANPEHTICTTCVRGVGDASDGHFDGSFAP